MKTYGFFEYVINEALILSEDEQKSIELIFEQIEKEYYSPIDSFSQMLSSPVWKLYYLIVTDITAGSL